MSMLKTCGLVVGVEKKTNRKDKQRDEKISVQIEFVGSKMVVNRAGKAKILQKKKKKSISSSLHKDEKWG